MKFGAVLTAIMVAGLIAFAGTRGQAFGQDKKDDAGQKGGACQKGGEACQKGGEACHKGGDKACQKSGEACHKGADKACQKGGEACHKGADKDCCTRHRLKLVHKARAAKCCEPACDAEPSCSAGKK